MNNLTVQNRNGVLLMDSREVAEMVEREHNELLKSIRQYCEYFNAGNFPLVDFFIESSYKDAKGQERPSYLITRKGCDMIANKLTGRKGVLFTAAYVTKFEEMEKKLESPKLPTDFLSALKALVSSEEEKQVLLLENKQQKQVIGEMKPKADYTDFILQNKGLVTITQIAKDYGMSGQKMNVLLHEYGVQYKQSDQWLLYEKYHDKGYTHSETIGISHKDGTEFVKMSTKWTQKGRLFIYNLLKKNEILPVIEQDKGRKTA